MIMIVSPLYMLGLEVEVESQLERSIQISPVIVTIMVALWKWKAGEGSFRSL